MAEKEDPPTLVKFIDEDLPEQLLPYDGALGADAVLLLKKDVKKEPEKTRMTEALTAWAQWSPVVKTGPKGDGAVYWAIWFKGTRKPSEDEIKQWLSQSEGGTAPINLNPPPVLGE
jgi:hypothetical protein